MLRFTSARLFNASNFFLRSWLEISDIQAQVGRKAKLHNFTFYVFNQDFSFRGSNNGDNMKTQPYPIILDHKKNHVIIVWLQSSGINEESRQ